MPMKVIAYYRQNPDPTVAEAELAVQRESVRLWLKEVGARLLFEVTEIEGGEKARPALGEARRLAKARDGVVLVATTKAIGPRGRFDPANGSRAPAIFTIEDPGEVERREWEKSHRFVVYLRQLVDGGAAAEALLAKQKAEVAELLFPSATVIATFLEEEQPDEMPQAVEGQPVRPALAQALALCREHRARLIVGTTDSLTPGLAPLSSDALADVPHQVAYLKALEWPEVIPVPFGLPAPISLHLGDIVRRSQRGLYLVNASGETLRNITLTRSGWTLGFGDLLQLNPFEATIESVTSGSGELVASYSIWFDSDFEISWRVSATTPDGRRWSGSLQLGKGCLDNYQLGLRDWAVVEKREEAKALKSG